MSLKTLLAGASLAAVALTAPAWAGDDHPAVREERVVVMTDHDPGKAGEHRECRIVIEEHHGGMDHMGAMHGMMDPSKGPITREAFLAEHAAMFDKLDLNHDGKLEPDEIEAAHHGHGGAMHEEMKDCHAMAAEHMGAHMGERMEMHGGDGPGPMSFEALDVNKDGRVTFDEFAAPLRKAFDKLDKSHKGYIEKSEWPNHIMFVLHHEHEAGPGDDHGHDGMHP
jgi:Ca2+-binding EF-hand superfamily protein